jgi:hypothetical protein
MELDGDRSCFASEAITATEALKSSATDEHQVWPATTTRFRIARHKRA